MEYFAPNTTDEALSLLTRFGEKAIPLAGGSFFMSHRNELFTKVEVLIDIKKLGLNHVETDREGIKIGSTNSLASLLESDIIKQGAFKAIQDAANGIKIPEIRNMATLGGNLSLSAEVDMPIPLLALDAQVVIAGSKGTRILPLDKFYLGYLSVALKPGEIITEIRVPNFGKNTGAAFQKLTRTSVDVPIVNAAARVTLDQNGRCIGAKMMLGGIAEIPIRADKVEKSLLTEKLEDAVITRAGDVAYELECMTDLRASNELRQRWAMVAIKRALATANKRAREGEVQ